jgi:hypothetical protein
MDPYDHQVVAGLGGNHFSKTLLELSDFIGIPPPEFRGRRVYKEYGLEKWEIQTIIRGHIEDPEDPTMDFTNAYMDWSHSVEIAMQGLWRASATSTTTISPRLHLTTSSVNVMRKVAPWTRGARSPTLFLGLT